MTGEVDVMSQVEDEGGINRNSQFHIETKMFNKVRFIIIL